MVECLCCYKAQCVRRGAKREEAEESIVIEGEGSNNGEEGGEFKEI